MKVRSICSVPKRSGHGGTVEQWPLFKADEFVSALNTLNANILNPGMAIDPVHNHEDVEQIWYILSGVGKARVGDEEREVREGDAVYLPPQVPHTMKNTGTYPLRFLAIGAKVT